MKHIPFYERNHSNQTAVETGLLGDVKRDVYNTIGENFPSIGGQFSSHDGLGLYASSPICFSSSATSIPQRETLWHYILVLKAITCDDGDANYTTPW